MMKMEAGASFTWSTRCEVCNGRKTQCLLCEWSQCEHDEPQCSAEAREFSSSETEQEVNGLKREIEIEEHDIDIQEESETEGDCEPIRQEETNDTCNEECCSRVDEKIIIPTKYKNLVQENIYPTREFMINTVSRCLHCNETMGIQAYFHRNSFGVCHMCSGCSGDNMSSIPATPRIGSHNSNRADPGRKVKCDYCEKSFATKRGVKIHIGHVHKGARPKI